MKRRAVIAVALTLGLLTYGCAPRQGAAEPDATAAPRPTITAESTPTATASPAQEPGFVSRATYGEDWPFTVESGKLACYDDPSNDRLYVVFDVGGGIEYALNGSARDFGFPELDATILKDFPDRAGTLALIEQGLTLC